MTQFSVSSLEMGIGTHSDVVVLRIPNQFLKNSDRMVHLRAEPAGTKRERSGGMKEDMSTENEEKDLNFLLARKAIKELNRRGVKASYVANRQEALVMLMEMIPAGPTIGTADSITLVQIGIISALKKRGKNKVINPHLRKSDGNLVVDSGKERDELMRKVFFSDIFLIGSNAVTLDGKIVNTDGYGNRVAAMIFGPRKVIIVIGANKIVRDVEQGIKRIREVCAPQIAIKHGKSHHRPQFLDLPCTKTGICIDCTHPWRACHYTTIIEGVMEPHKGRIEVIIVGERLGI